MGFACGDARQHFNGSWTTGAGGRASGRVDSLQFEDAGAAPDLNLQGRASLKSGRLSAEFSATHAALHARLSDGRMLQGIRFSATGQLGKVTLRLRDDYALVRAHVLDQHLANAEVFDSGIWMSALLREFNSTVHLRPVVKLPPLQVEPPVIHPSSGSVAQFDRHCGQCHNTSERFPPNFLHGDPATLNRQLEHCAERIYYRLSMWRLPETRRGKTPMPPLAALATRGLDADRWAHSSELAALAEDMRRRLQAQGEAPELVLSRPFEQLRSCLPAADLH